MYEKWSIERLFGEDRPLHTSLFTGLLHAAGLTHLIKVASLPQSDSITQLSANVAISPCEHTQNQAMIKKSRNCLQIPDARRLT
jgi:hypothetical protein